VTAIHVSLCQPKSTSILLALWRALVGLMGIDGCARLPLGRWFLLSSRTGHPFAV
jgi:hypothetical protein